MNIEINRNDIEDTVKEILEAMMHPLHVEQKLELLEWLIEILTEIQDTVE